MVERIERHLANYSGTFSPIFLTVTAPAQVADVAAWNESAPRRFAAFMRVLRRSAMAEAEYARVLELQRRGLLHVHAIVTGWRFVPDHLIRAAAVAHGFGPRVEFKPVRTGAGLARYMASNYLAKSHEDLGRRYRVVQYSRGWAGVRVWDEDGIGAALNVVDPVVGAVPGRMSWSRWADRMIAKGRGDYLVKPMSSGWPPSGPGMLFDDA